MRTTTLSLLFAVSLLQADCSFSQPGNIDVTWQAYKTPLKAGVGGHFGSVEYKAASSAAETLDGLLVGSAVKIAVASVDSKNKGRDEKLLNDFFRQMAGPDISAKIISLKSDNGAGSGLLVVSVVMNGVTREVPMRYTLSNGQLSAKGVIDLVDFSAQKALASINKACYDLHQGKTWSDVDVGFTLDIKTDCTK